MINVHSAYSLRYGIVQPEELVYLSEKLGYGKIVLTDINNTSGVLNFVRYSMEHNRVPAVGVDFRNGVSCCYIALAKNNEGFHEINCHLTHHNHNELPFPDRAPEFSNCFVIYPWGKEPAELRENEWIGVAAHQLNRFRMHKKTNCEKFLALHSMTFRSKKDFNTHRLLRAIDNNVLLSKLPKSEESREDELFLSKEDLMKLFMDFPELTEHTELILDNCSIEFDFDRTTNSQNIVSYTDSKEQDLELVKELCDKALTHRYEKRTPEITKRIEKEIDVIYQKNYLSYFLVAWDIVSYARNKGYFYVGRGSGANSIVAYLLGITDVDPLELDLYFERFINLYRENPPDFDIDFSWRDRDDVMRYIFETFKNSALICTYNTFQSRATIRELGKVFGLPKTDIDVLTGDEKNTKQLDQMQKLVLKYSRLIAGLPSHLSVHAGGIVVSHRPITHFTSTFLTSKSFPTTQFSMIEAEDIGLYKFDILSQRGLGKIRDTLDVIAYNQPGCPPHDIHDVRRFITDDKINTLLSQAKAIGCFYVESPAMRMLMIKLRTNSYLGLVAASSIIRPGVASSGMMREYILRHRDPERVKQAHPKLLEIMEETYGVMVYQEDVIKVANHYAGLSLAESDVLRRGMSGKFKGRDEFMAVEAQFFKNCKERGYPDEEVKAIWFQIESFAGYAFSKGHSASYAVESYQCLYLKAYYPLEYMVATMNNFGGFYHTEMYMREAQKLGGIIEAPCVNTSRNETTINGKRITLGFQHVSALESKTIQTLIDERTKGGNYQSLDDLIARLPISLEQLVLLIRVGALRTFGVPKKELLWRAHLINVKPKAKVIHPKLFVEEQRKYTLPELTEVDLETVFDQFELFEFPLCNPFDLVGQTIKHEVRANNLNEFANQNIVIYGYFVTVKKVKSAKGFTVHFGTLLDVDGEQLDTVHFQEAATKWPYRGKGIYEIHGKVAEEFEHYTIEVDKVFKIPYCEDPRYSDNLN